MDNRSKYFFVGFKDFRLLKKSLKLRHYKLPILEISPIFLQKTTKGNIQDIYSLAHIVAIVGVISFGIMICYMAKLLLNVGGIWVILGSMVLISMVIGLSISLKLAFFYSWLRRYSS